MADEQLMSVFKEGVHASYRVACLTTVPRVTNITRKSSFKPLRGGGLFISSPFERGGRGLNRDGSLIERRWGSN